MNLDDAADRSESEVILAKKSLSNELEGIILRQRLSQ